MMSLYYPFPRKKTRLDNAALGFSLGASVALAVGALFIGAYQMIATFGWWSALALIPLSGGCLGAFVCDKWLEEGDN